MGGGHRGQHPTCFWIEVEVDVCEMSLIYLLGNRDRNRGFSSGWLLAYLSLSGWWWLWWTWGRPQGSMLIVEYVCRRELKW